MSVRRSATRKPEEIGAEAFAGGKADPLSDNGLADPVETTAAPASACDFITRLHAAKEELADEMEANLKQLREVLKETKRIAEQMEAVLKEARCAPEPEKPGRKQREERDRGWQVRGDAPEWEPPDDLSRYKVWEPPTDGPEQPRA